MSKHHMKATIRAAAIGVASALVAAGATAYALPPSTGGGGNDPAGNPVSRGPAPTSASLNAARGPYQVRSQTVSSSVSGFGGGTIYYPTGAGTGMAAIAVVPGYVSPQSDIQWWGPKLASWGFVVITIDTNSPFDFPASRGNQLSAALDYLVDESARSGRAISGLVDPGRLGAVGWSMGGGGALDLAVDRDLDAIIPTAAWNNSSSGFSSIDTPTLMLTCQNDAIAANSSFSTPFYNDIPNSTSKMTVEIAGADHFCVTTNGGNQSLLGRLGVSWMKAHIDEDARFEPFLCATNYAARGDVSSQRNNCRFP